MMTKIFQLVMVFIMTAFTIDAQDIAGEWNGTLIAGAQKLRLVFHITKTTGGYSATMDSPDQGAKAIPVTRVTFVDSLLTLSMDNLKAEYTGVLKGGVISGTFKQAGFSFPLEMKRGMAEIKPLVRPQEPKAPFPYRSEEVTFMNEHDKIKLSGTLTFPEGPGRFPAVVLISGSGPQNRNEEIFGHKPFWVLADALTRKGIAVLRFDDRGTHASGGTFPTATTFDFARDVEAAVSYLLSREEVNSRRIGLIGHSEGGIIAPIVAGRNRKISFIVLLAGTSMRGDQLLLKQSELIQRASGIPDKDIERSSGINRGLYDLVIRSGESGDPGQRMEKYLREKLASMPESDKPSGMTDDQFVKMALSQLNTPWMINFIRYDPVPALEKVKCPVMALNGSKDLQVPPENLEGIRVTLLEGGNKKSLIREYPGLNHLFQECSTGLPAEYMEIEQTISPEVLDDISEWILSLKR